jgi:hypothetical protein
MCVSKQVRNEKRLPMFALGTVVATPGALACLERWQTGVWPLLARHQTGDWGELSQEDMRENERAVATGLRVLSSYPLGNDERIWIITEADRSVTTLLLPEEY